ncbi:hypothetical protein UP10_16010 [Bradyrhizobium sp. LTSPM299]|uniref:hypothetical protein n=1 Tax=Bradyrhizobium sp. LTSPM299 TaxID=1619233 RepID=UPI0005C9D215|nr:hypothetical protein [Bradyrhizobium sp. LTSPM299]KJC56874.1 hypothetical protein UP10_32190 [Bradyrhizobium sp. LTSPM299]KJC59527.1 hypothetical protein UP10_18765 [Bradyrhizobium sp. LTSPM299]KJC60148.1 hypothetical protein UP10_16010 [Bradyrhizobium sp. LTSPM299]
MPEIFTHKGVTFSVTRKYDDQFEIIILLDDQSIRSTVRTRLLELARRRAEMLINRKLKERIRRV